MDLLTKSLLTYITRHGIYFCTETRKTVEARKNNKKEYGKEQRENEKMNK
jgi:hypothetical protein